MPDCSINWELAYPAVSLAGLSGCDRTTFVVYCSSELVDYSDSKLNTNPIVQYYSPLLICLFHQQCILNLMLKRCYSNGVCNVYSVCL